MDLAITQRKEWRERTIQATINTVTSKNTQRLYKGAIQRFLDWYIPGEYSSLAVALDAYKHILHETKMASTVNAEMYALSTYFKVAVREGYLDQQTYEAVRQVKPLKVGGQRTGIWLSADQLRQLRDTPDDSTAVGLRDKMVLYLLIGCGLRRAEACSLTWGHFVKQGNSWQIKNLIGKGNKMRTIGVPQEVIAVLKQVGWGEKDTKVLYRLNKTGVRTQGLSDISVWKIVKHYAEAVCGFGAVRPHDLRRSIAQILYDSEGIVAVRQFLGHSTIAVTEKYLGKNVNLEKMAEGLSLGKNDEHKDEQKSL